MIKPPRRNERGSVEATQFVITACVVFQEIVNVEIHQQSSNGTFGKLRAARSNFEASTVRVDQDSFCEAEFFDTLRPIRSVFPC